MSVILLCSCMCKEGMAYGRTHLLRECSPHSEDADDTKANFSSITTLAKLRQYCTKTKKIVWNMDKSWPSKAVLTDIWTTECTRETFCDWWMTLWSSECTYLENVPFGLMPLAHDVVYFGEAIQKWGRKAVILAFISACFKYQTKFYVDTKNINNT